MRRRAALAGVGAIATVALGVAAGLWIGQSESTSVQEAEDTSRAAEAEAHDQAFQAAFESAADEGLDKGLRAGRSNGEDAGSDDGRAAGVGAADAELAAQARAAEEAAAAEAAERTENCGAPLFVDGYCPTDEEIAYENTAESLCGGGTAEGRAEAAELGIQC